MPPVTPELPASVSSPKRPAEPLALAVDLGVDPLAEIRRLLTIPTARPRVVVALSGGMDSTALLLALADQRESLAALRALHVNHHLMPNAGEWVQHCRRLTRSLRVPLQVLDAKVSTDASRSLEERARAARYQLFAAALRPQEVLVVAQHADDQAETVLLQLLRGAGVAGLAAMPAIAPLGAGCLVRPLLGLRRVAIERYVRARQLTWIEDESNDDLQRARNFLRHRAIPVLSEYWPGAVRTLARSARHLAEADQLLTERAREDLARAADGLGLVVMRLRMLALPRRKNLLRHWIAARGFRVPDATRLDEIAGPVLAARRDAQPQVAWDDAQLRRAAGRLELHRVAAYTPLAATWRWRLDEPYDLQGNRGTVVLQSDRHGPIDLDRLPPALELRPRVGGERIRPGPRARQRALKALLQEAGLTPDERARLPLFWQDERLLLVGDRWTDASVHAQRGSARRGRLILAR